MVLCDLGFVTGIVKVAAELLLKCVCACFYGGIGKRVGNAMNLDKVSRLS